MSLLPKKREIAIEIAKSYLGTPYIWGGDDPEGFDCSGFAIEILKSVGILPRRGDWTAYQLWERLKEFKAAKAKLGCLVFWQNKNGKVIHVEFCLTDDLAIGASGGGSKVTNREAAMKYNAFVKVRPIESRKGIFGFLDPFSKPLKTKIDVE